jgi:hypothetical protein
MNNYILIVGALSLFVSNAAMAEHGEPSGSSVLAPATSRYCCPILDQGDFAVLACLQQHREKLTRLAEKSSLPGQ